MIKNIIFIITTAILLASCSKDSLDLIPENALTMDGFYNNETDIQQAVNAVYNRFSKLPVYHFLYLSEIRSNNLYAISHNAQRDWYDINTYSYTASTGTFYTVWLNDYRVITAANALLANIGNVTFQDSTLKKRYKCEVRFLRAYTYFELVRSFARVPLITTPVTSQEALTIEQSERDAIYAFITSEMEDVLTNGNLSGKYTSTDLGRLTKYGAEALLGRVYLTMAGWPLYDQTAYAKARTHLENVISAEGSSTSNVVWNTDYASMFKIANDNKNYLFEAQYVAGSNSTGTTYPISVVPADFDATLIPSSSYGIASALELTTPKALIKTFEAGDKRFSVTIDTLQYTTNTTPKGVGKTPFFCKFLNLSSPEAQSDSRNYGINIPIIRYADVLLMEAEILNAQTGPTAVCTATGLEAGKTATDLLNKIRTRAGLASIAPASQADFATAMETERRCEFAFEGLYWNDLVRNGRAVTVMNAWFQSISSSVTITENNLILPIPQTEIDKGLYEQNP
jgi:starch-binding outer membrane protein, SusD/RagB family